MADIARQKEQRENITINTSKKGISIILLISCVLSPIIGFSIAAIVENVSFFGWFGLLRCTWIIYLFILVPILNLMYGLVGKAKKWVWLKNVIVARAIAPLLLFYESFGAIYNPVIDYSDAIFRSVENKVSVLLPNKLECVTKIGVRGGGDYEIAKILVYSEQLNYESSLSSSPFLENFPSPFKEVSPKYIYTDIFEFDYFCLYNSTAQEFNKAPIANGTYEMAFFLLTNPLLQR